MRRRTVFDRGQCVIRGGFEVAETLSILVCDTLTKTCVIWRGHSAFSA